MEIHPDVKEREKERPDAGITLSRRCLIARKPGA
jgi:hypothetical protein